MQVMCLPNGNGREKQLILRRPDGPSDRIAQPLWPAYCADPDVGIEQELHNIFLRRFLSPSKAPTGPTISPTISVHSRMPPRTRFFGAGSAGTTSAIGLPCRVIRTGLRVLRTDSSTDKHVALNLVTAISCMIRFHHARPAGSICGRARHAPTAKTTNRTHRNRFSSPTMVKFQSG